MKKVERKRRRKRLNDLPCKWEQRRDDLYPIEPSEKGRLYEFVKARVIFFDPQNLVIPKSIEL